MVSVDPEPLLGPSEYTALTLGAKMRTDAAGSRRGRRERGRSIGGLAGPEAWARGRIARGVGRSQVAWGRACRSGICRAGGFAGLDARRIGHWKWGLGGGVAR